MLKDFNIRTTYRNNSYICTGNRREVDPKMKK